MLHELQFLPWSLTQTLLAVCLARAAKQKKTRATSHYKWTRGEPLAMTEALHTQTKYTTKTSDRIEQRWSGPWPPNRSMILLHVSLSPAGYCSECAISDLSPKPFAVHEMYGQIDMPGPTEIARREVICLLQVETDRYTTYKYIMDWDGRPTSHLCPHLHLVSVCRDASSKEPINLHPTASEHACGS